MIGQNIIINRKEAAVVVEELFNTGYFHVLVPEREYNRDLVFTKEEIKPLLIEVSHKNEILLSSWVVNYVRKQVGFKEKTRKKEPLTYIILDLIWGLDSDKISLEISTKEVELLKQELREFVLGFKNHLAFQEAVSYLCLLKLNKQNITGISITSGWYPGRYSFRVDISEGLEISFTEKFIDNLIQL